VQWAIARGLETTGITTMLMDEGMDTGPMLLQRQLPIGHEETAQELAGRMARLGAELLIETLELWEAGRIQAQPQPAEGVTYAPILRKEHGYLDWSMSAAELAWRVRGFWPWPGSVCRAPDGGSLKVHRARAIEGKGQPGTVLDVSEAGVAVAAGSGALLLEEVQPENRKRMGASDYARGQRLRPGAVLGQLQPEAPTAS
jgi:methionyl-tRNA formyltransferase